MAKTTLHGKRPPTTTQPSKDTPARRSAVALAYREGSAAPKVVAKGRGETALRIIERAREAGVFVHESPELVGLLMQVDLDQHIPPNLYQAVAEILVFVYYLEQQAGKVSSLSDG